jgi:hypothetical protein
MVFAPDGFAGEVGLIRKLDIFQNRTYVAAVNGMTGIM